VLFVLVKFSQPFIVSSLCQELNPHPDDIFSLWKLRKILSTTAKEEIIKSRAKNTRSLLETIDFVTDEEKKESRRCMIEERSHDIESSQRPFKPHAAIDLFMDQFGWVNLKQATRFQALLLVGYSRSGKTQKGISLYGANHTLVVNCQTISPHLPSLKEYDSDKHSAILFDEIDQDQVLHNKVVFQSPNVPVKLGQSACNQHMYELWIHGTPLILCSNTFSFTRSKNGNPIPEVDQGWLRENLIVVERKVGEKWWFEEPVVPQEDALGSQESLVPIGHGFG
jgi:hypothetical protein